MLSTNFTEKLLDLQEVNITNVIDEEDFIKVFMKKPVTLHSCPNCKTKTKYVHNYREQVIKDIPILGKKLLLIYKKRRYRCPKCGKCFYESVSFLPRYYRVTNRLVSYVLDKLHEVRSYTSVAKEVNLSTSTVIRYFDLINYKKPELPEVLSIDEFKGNTNGEKYQCIITDPKNGIVLDILPQRYSHYLSSYFKNIDRHKVKFFVSDMWKVYSDFASTYFKNAIQIVDKYHWIRQVIWAFEAVRKEEQKKFSKTHRIYFKHSKALLTSRFKHLTDEQKQQVNVMLYASATLSTAHYLKEKFLDILDCKDKQSAKKAMSEWILSAQGSSIKSFISCSNTMINWSIGILNSFDYPYTNGFTEGCNNKIKVLKRNAYGYRNFKRFRNRILHIFYYQKSKTSKVAA